MDNLMCIYHGNCPDGFGAALAVHCGYLGKTTNIEGDLATVDIDKNIEFIEGIYGQPPPDVKGRDVLYESSN